MCSVIFEKIKENPAGQTPGRAAAFACPADTAARELFAGRFA